MSTEHQEPLAGNLQIICYDIVTIDHDLIQVFRKLRSMLPLRGAGGPCVQLEYISSEDSGGTRIIVN